jgi:hypothetical protein
METKTMKRITESSPRLKARIAGLIYLITIVTGIFGLGFVRGRLVVDGDAAATATNILAHESLFRLGFVAVLVGTASYVAVTALLYALLKPVNPSLSLHAAFFSLVGCAVWALGCVFNLAQFVVLGGEQYLSVFKPEQLQALALMLLKLNGEAFSVGMVFFGFYCLLIGYLIFRSTFLPRIVGMLMALAGLGHLIAMFANFLSPAFADHLFPYILWPGLLGEGSVTLWLLVMGVNASRWKEQANAAMETRS